MLQWGGGHQEPACCGLSGTWLGPRLEGVERECAAAAAIAQMAEEAGGCRQAVQSQGKGGLGTQEVQPPQRSLHRGGPTGL